MMRPPRRFPTVAGFDLNSGPEGMDDHDTLRRSRILGNLRRNAPVESLPPLLQSESLDRELKNLVGRYIGPGARGGEDLSPLSKRQVELVRFQYTQTIHQEAWSFRATKGRARIYYAGADESEAGITPAMRSTRTWPSLGKLIWMLDRSWCGEGLGLYFGDLCLRVGNSDERPEELRDFIEVSSFFYPAIASWYEAAFEAWLRAIPPKVSLDNPVDSIALLAAAQ